tara:strand:+ start:1093 stop:2865 length:1773 start_codon:yes stop_codon:yes gene_type:complete
MANPEKDLAYWQKKLGLRPTIRGTYIDEKGRRREIFKGPYTSNHYESFVDGKPTEKEVGRDIKDIIQQQSWKNYVKKLPFPPPANEFPTELQKMLHEKQMELIDTAPMITISGDRPIPEGSTLYPDNPEQAGNKYEQLHAGEYYSQAVGNERLDAPHISIPMPEERNITYDDLAVTFEERIHGDKNKISNDPYLLQTLFGKPYRHKIPIATKSGEDDYIENYTPASWSNLANRYPKFVNLRGPISKEYDNNLADLIFSRPKGSDVVVEKLPPLSINSSYKLQPSDIFDTITSVNNTEGTLKDNIINIEEIPFSPEAFDIADANLKDLQGLSTIQFNPKHTSAFYGDDRYVDLRRLIEEGWVKEQVEDYMSKLSYGDGDNPSIYPFETKNPSYFDWTKGSYMDLHFDRINAQDQLLQNYLALTGPLRDRTKPIWENEIRHPVMQWPLRGTDHRLGIKQEKLLHPWDEVPTFVNPYPEFARAGSAAEWYSKLLEPISKGSWFDSMRLDSIYHNPNQSNNIINIEDPNQLNQLKEVPFSHVNQSNIDTLLPYFKDWKQSNLYGGDYWKGLSKYDYREERDFAEWLAELNNTSN